MNTCTTCNEIHTVHHQSEWQDDDGTVLWWLMPVCQPPYLGDPTCNDWPFHDGEELYWTRLPNVNKIMENWEDIA